MTRHQVSEDLARQMLAGQTALGKTTTSTIARAVIRQHLSAGPFTAMTSPDNNQPSTPPGCRTSHLDRVSIACSPDPTPCHGTDRSAQWSALPGWLKLFAGADDLGRGPFNGVAEDVGPAPAAPVVRVVVVPAVDTVVVGGFGATGFGLAHRREGNRPGREPNSRPDWGGRSSSSGFRHAWSPSAFDRDAPITYAIWLLS